MHNVTTICLVVCLLNLFINLLATSVFFIKLIYHLYFPNLLFFLYFLIYLFTHLLIGSFVYLIFAGYLEKSLITIPHLKAQGVQNAPATK